MFCVESGPLPPPWVACGHKHSFQDEPNGYYCQVWVACSVSFVSRRAPPQVPGDRSRRGHAGAEFAPATGSLLCALVCVARRLVTLAVPPSDVNSPTDWSNHDATARRDDQSGERGGWRLSPPNREGLPEPSVTTDQERIAGGGAPCG